VDTAGTLVPTLGHWSEIVQALDVATGRIRYIAPGQWIFPSAGGRELYISQMDDTSLIELPTTGKGNQKTLVLPTGWYLSSGAGVFVGDGIAVQGTDDTTTGRPTELAVWSPGTGNVEKIGVISAGYSKGILAFGVLGAYTPPESRYGVIAWFPAGWERRAPARSSSPTHPALRDSHCAAHCGSAWQRAAPSLPTGDSWRCS